MKKIRAIVTKEWAEVFRNRLVLFTVAFLPLILMALPLVTLAFTAGLEEDMSSLSDAAMLEMFGERCAGLTELACTEVYTLDLFTLMFMILPVSIPVTIAAYSIVGEKTTRSLEPLLATPITTAELLAAKAVAAVVPAIVATWSAYVVYVVGVRLMVSDAVFARVLDPMWLIAIFVVGPLLTLLSVMFAMIVSSRVSDPRVAEQLATLVILPLIVLVIGQSVGFILVSQQMIIVIGLVVAILDGVLLYLSVRLFEREVILTRWK